MAILTCVRLIAGHKERSYVYLFFECQRSAMLASKYKDSFCVWYVIGTAKQKIMYDKHYLRKKERNKRRRTDDTFITGIAILKRNYAETQIIIRRRSLLTSLCCFVVLHSTIVLLPRIHISTHRNGFWLCSFVWSKVHDLAINSHKQPLILATIHKWDPRVGFRQQATAKRLTKRCVFVSHTDATMRTLIFDCSTTLRYEPQAY